jgi:hypothetical protein
VLLNGGQGPNNGWLVLLVAAFALGWTRPMNRGSWIGVVGVLGASIVMASTVVENVLDSRHVLGATASYGSLLVLVASVALAAHAVTRGVELAHSGRATS